MATASDNKNEKEKKTKQLFLIVGREHESHHIISVEPSKIISWFQELKDASLYFNYYQYKDHPTNSLPIPDSKWVSYFDDLEEEPDDGQQPKSNGSTWTSNGTDDGPQGLSLADSKSKEWYENAGNPNTVTKPIIYGYLTMFASYAMTLWIKGDESPYLFSKVDPNASDVNESDAEDESDDTKNNDNKS
jgi:hypothetical protein